MPEVKQCASYTSPRIACHKAGARHENTFVITNTEHSKTTNPGYKRGNSGGFYCH